MADETVTTEAPSEATLTERLAEKFAGLGAELSESAPQTTEEAASEFAEVDWNGEKFQVPAKLKEAFIHNADYTQKTQKLADQQRALDHIREVAEQGQAQQAFMSSVAAEHQELAVIDAYLAQMSKTDWSQMPIEQMFRAKAELDTIKERKAALKETISNKRAEFDKNLTTKISELRAKSRELASRSITGFNEQAEKDVRTYAQSEGLNDREIDNVLLDPRSFKVLWKAMQYEKVVASTGKAVQTAQKVMKPGAASERMPAKTAADLNFRKAMGTAKTSGQKAQVIEQRLAKQFGG